MDDTFYELWVEGEFMGVVSHDEMERLSEAGELGRFIQINNLP